MTTVEAELALDAAEVVFLEAFGWTRGEEPDTWREPTGRRDRTLRQGHAVNSQKWHNAHGPDGPLAGVADLLGLGKNGEVAP